MGLLLLLVVLLQHRWRLHQRLWLLQPRAGLLLGQLRRQL
jgi:hypothetical protein